MVNIVTKKIKGKEYLYLVKSVRKGDKVSQKTIKYLGKKRLILKEEFECVKYSEANKDWILQRFNDGLSYKKHQQMRKLSQQYQKYLGGLVDVSSEKERFLSKFISNSNSIEGSTMTVTDTFNYLFQNVVPIGYTKKELYMVDNLFQAWNYVEKNSSRLPTIKDLLHLHFLVNRNIESERTLGKYKSVQNYIGDIYTTSVFYVPEKIEELLQWVKKAFIKIDDFEVAFQSHAQFEVIHPFLDGNGRVGRLLLNWLLMYKHLSPLAITVKVRAEYLIALENSRRGKIEAICVFCYQQYLAQYQFMSG